MTESRRSAVRLSHGGAGELRFNDRAAPCLVLDISVTGARVRLTPPTLVPDRVSLAARLGEREFVAPGTVRRAETGSVVAISFDDGDRVGLGRLIAAEQRRRLAGRVQLSPERRPVPREPA